MSAQSIHDLLPIPRGTVEPHPYQILGLEIGVHDPKTIRRAAQSAAVRLKDIKSTTEPKLWKQAAYLVKGAHEILSDPAKKASLDARLGIVPGDAATTLATASPPPELSLADPLAGLLPEGDPFALPPAPASIAPAELAPTEPRPSIQLIDPPPASPSLQAPIEAEFVPSVTALPEIQPVVVNAARPRRRRSWSGPLTFSVFVLASLGIIGTLVYLLVLKSVPQTLASADGPASMATSSPSANDAVVVSRPRSVESTGRRTSRDPIMGSLVGQDSDPSSPRQPSGLTAGLINTQPTDTSNEATLPGALPTELTMPDPLPSEPAMPDLTAMMEPSSPMTAPSEPGATPLEPTQAPAMAPLSDTAIAQAEQTLQQVRDVVRRADWKQMKPAAEAALEMPMSDAQKASAQALFELADLASYYRVGIEKSVAELKVGNDFELSDNLRVIVVETGEDRLVVRFDAKNRSFTLDELPWALAHKLATFSIPDSATTQAAKAVYQAIAPKSSDAHRQQALQWLEDIQGEVEGADASQLAETIRNLFADS
jgi:hypothetical protein